MAQIESIKTKLNNIKSEDDNNKTPLNMEEIISETNYESLAKQLRRCVNFADIVKTKCTSILEDIEQNYTDDVFYNIKDLPYTFEKMYFNFRALSVFDETFKNNLYDFGNVNEEILGELYDFNATISQENQSYYLLKLPVFFNKRQVNNSAFKSYFMYYIVSNLVQKLLSDIDYSNRLFQKSTIVFEYHIPKKNNFFVMDNDNIDLSGALNAINGSLIAEDSMDLMNLFQVVVFDEEAYTKMHVLNEDYIETWLTVNMDLFTNNGKINR